MLDKLAAIQMLDVHFPTTDGRTLILSRYTEPNADQKLLRQLKLDLPPQPPPRIAVPVRPRSSRSAPCRGNPRQATFISTHLSARALPQLRKSG